MGEGRSGASLPFMVMEREGRGAWLVTKRHQRAPDTRKQSKM